MQKSTQDGRLYRRSTRRSDCYCICPRLTADEVLATVAGDAVDFIGLKALRTMEFDSSATVLLY
jgi:hypothetical protein